MGGGGQEEEEEDNSFICEDGYLSGEPASGIERQRTGRAAL